MSEPKRITGLVYVGTLPKSDHEWAMLQTPSGTVILANADHPPRMVVDGKIEIIEPADLEFP